MGAETNSDGGRCRSVVLAAGQSVKTYEIRVLPREQVGADIYASSHLDDHAAVRRAIALAKPGQAIEVWCGTRCVYAGMPSQVTVH